MAGADAFSPCICTADLAGDGEFRLVVATASKKMKYIGTEELPLFKITSANHKGNMKLEWTTYPGTPTQT